MKLYLQDPRWGGTTTYRQSSQFSGVAGVDRWSSAEWDDYDYLLCSEPKRLPPRLYELPIRKRICLLQENPMVWKPEKDFLAQFGWVICPFNLDLPSTTRHIKEHAAVQWFYGVDFKTDAGLLHIPLKSSIELDTIERSVQKKKKLVSMITSSKGGLPGHRWRVAVANELRKKLKEEIDIFGFGHRPLGDKRDALDDYMYSVVLENCESEHYWTEKLSDCLLGRSMPIYSGAKNAIYDLEFSFPTIGYGKDPEVTAQEIVMALEKGTTSQHELEKARRLVLKRHNILYWIPELMRRNDNT